MYERAKLIEQLKLLLDTKPDNKINRFARGLLLALLGM
jgi:hypothetical protein